MIPTKFIVCLLLFFYLLHTAPHLVQATEILSKPYDDFEGEGRNDNGTNPSNFHYLVTGGYRPKENLLVKYAVSLRVGEPRGGFFGANHNCGGSIISLRAILTAGHCLFTQRGVLFTPKQIQVFAGTPLRLEEAKSTQVIRVKNVLPHPKYSPRSHNYDLGIVKLKKKIKLNEDVAIINLNKEPTKAGLECTVLGWGTVIQHGPCADEVINADVQILEKSFCMRLGSFNPEGMICARNRDNTEIDSCQGDSGGPLIAIGSEKLVGVVSFGQGCGESYSAGIYTDVYHYYSWIKRNSASYQEVSLSLGVPLLLIFFITAFGL